jgi:hypothetical protein
MRKHEVEAWALDVIDRVINGQQVEDSRVELKATWIDARKAARRIAGHANASRGEPALWLIGVDEVGAVPGVAESDFADWYARVSACFDDIAPHVTELAIRHGNVTVMALLFDTDRAPFVVKCEGGGIHREVPYRHGTRCDAATRQQLLRVLSSPDERRDMELVSCLLIANPQGGQKKEFFIRLTAAVLLLQKQSKQTYLASHRASATVDLGNGMVVPIPVRFRPEYNGWKQRARPSIELVGPSGFWVSTDLTLKAGYPTTPLLPRPARLELRFAPPDVDEIVVIETLSQIGAELSKGVMRWSFQRGIQTTDTAFGGLAIDGPPDADQLSYSPE